MIPDLKVVDCIVIFRFSTVALCFQLLHIDSKATASVPSPTVNLSELHPGITMNDLMAAVGWQYMKTDDLSKSDKGWRQVQKQKGFQMVNPSEEWFPGKFELSLCCMVFFSRSLTFVIHMSISRSFFCLPNLADIRLLHIFSRF